MNTRVFSGWQLAYLYRTLAALCVLAGAWAVLIWLTGGFRIAFWGFRISSRHPRNALVISLVCAALVWLLSLLPGGRSSWADEWARWRHAASQAWPRARNAMLVITSAFAIAAAAIAIDVYQWSNTLPLWVDEEMIALNVRDRSWNDLSGTLWLGQSAPFGWLVLERMAMATIGTSEAAVRAVPLMFGMATIGTAAWVGRRWMGWIGATVFVLLCWLGPYLSHYRFEVKHYTADILFGLLLPALAAWAIEPDRPSDRQRRIWLWWLAAAVGHWLANGALLVIPACAVFLSVAAWRRDGLRAAAWFGAGGLLWLASLGLHYLISIRDTLNNTYLQSTWIKEMLPPSLGPAGTIRWFLDRLDPLASNPGGTTLSTLFWASAMAGLAFSARRPLGLALAGIPVSAFAVAAVVPLHQRFSIWIVPALYAGIALLIDRAVGVGRTAFARRSWLVVGTAVLVLVLQSRLVSDILTRGKTDLEARLHSTVKHQLDDKLAVAWLRSRFEPGDVLITTPLALPAVWWYWKIPLSDEAGAGRFLHDGSPVFEAYFTTDCRAQPLDDALKNRGRVLLYLGFDVDPRFDQLLLDNLSRLGRMTARGEFGELGRTAVIDLRMPPSDSPIRLDRPVPSGDAVDGCAGVRPARRW